MKRVNAPYPIDFSLASRRRSTIRRQLETGGRTFVRGVGGTLSRSKRPTPRGIAAPPKWIEDVAGDVRQIIESTRIRVAQSVKAELVMMNWKIGILDVLDESRIEFGIGIVSTLSRQFANE